MKHAVYSTVAVDFTSLCFHCRFLKQLLGYNRTATGHDAGRQIL